MHMIRGAHDEPKCRIFTFEHEKHGVPHLSKISPNYANYCEYFVPVNDELPKNVTEKAPVPSDKLEDTMAIGTEEKIVINKEIAYPATESAQHDMKNALTRYLDDGYSIKAVKLIKTESTLQPKRKRLKAARRPRAAEQG